MNYIIFVEKDDESMMFHAPVPEENAAYLRDRVAPTLRPLRDEAYMLGPAVILKTLARYSYVLDEHDLYWCAEWDPGLLVVRFSPNHSMAWTAIRSPVPAFGGRTPKQEDLDSYDETAVNHQYRLVFDPWDAQLDERIREWRSFKPVDEEARRAYRAAIDHVNSLGDIMELKYSNDATKWVETCIANISDWAGSGHRLD